VGAGGAGAGEGGRATTAAKAKAGGGPKPPSRGGGAGAEEPGRRSRGGGGSCDRPAFYATWDATLLEELAAQVAFVALERRYVKLRSRPRFVPLFVSSLSDPPLRDELVLLARDPSGCGQGGSFS